MSERKVSHREVKAGLASAIGAAIDVEATATYTVPATEDAQHQLGRRLAPATKEANRKRSATKEAGMALAHQLRNQGLNTKQVIHAVAESLGAEESPAFARKVYRWLAAKRAE